MEAAQKNMLGAMLEQSVRETAAEQARTEVEVIKVAIIAEMAKIGVSSHMTPLYALTDHLLKRRTDSLVHAKLATIVSGLVGAAPVAELGQAAAAPAAGDGLASVAHVGPGDTLVISSATALTVAQRDQVAAYARANLAPGCHVIVLSGGIQVAAVVKAALAPAPTIVSTLVVGVDTSQIDAALVKLAQLEAAQAGVLVTSVPASFMPQPTAELAQSA